MFIIQREKLENDFLRIILGQNELKITEKIELKDNEKWIPVISSLNGYSTLIFNNNGKSISKPLEFKNGTENCLYYSFNDSELIINLQITLNEFLHFRYKIQNKKTIKNSSILAKYSILLDKDPDFTWVPLVRPKRYYVIPDHVFRSPVIIYRRGKTAFSMIPDLEILGQNRHFQTLMDFNLKVEETSGNPEISFGFGNYETISHIMFKHNPNKKMRIKSNSELSIGYFLLFFNNKSDFEILKAVNEFLWERYGKKLLYHDLAPQVIPYDINVEEGYKAIFERHKFWGNFKINDNDCGGIWQQSWMGNRKKKVKFIKPEELKKFRESRQKNFFSYESMLSKIIMYFSNSPFWIKRFEKFTQSFGIIERPAEMWNNAWFLNIRTAYGIRFFGDFWKNNDYIEKGNRMLNTVLSLPRIRGIFPSVVLPAAPDSNVVSTINGVRAFLHTDDFHTVDACLAMYWAIKYYQDFEKREIINEKSLELFNLIKEIQLENGAIPTYISFSGDKSNPEISDILIDSASSGASLMFLVELYKISRNEQIIPTAEKIADFLQTEIIPIDKWHDFEPFFSCTHLPLDFFDDYTKSHAMNALCIYWCAEGFKELYKVTNKEEYLKSGERILAVLSLFQQIWDMPYISFNTFGGFCSQNTDAELSDARQALFVKTYMEYYLITGRKEYMERGIAALRASWTLQLLKEYENQAPGNIKGIKTINGIDKGCLFENYGHSGHDLRVPGYITFDWGVGSAATATAYAKKHFGDIFIDFKEAHIWGIDGIKIQNFEFGDNFIKISFNMIEYKKYIIFKARETPEKNYDIILNGKNIGIKTKKMLNEGFLYNCSSLT
ncbi:MAG: hypothetical protein ACTSRG_11070 [Candidatus Helarchaeota archaeon]